MEIKELKKQDDIREAVALANRVFLEFIAPDCGKKGRHTFAEYVRHKENTLIVEIKNGEKRMWGAYENGELAGILASRDVTHISLLFVDKKYHRCGIARALVDNFISGLGGAETVTVHSSPYAVPFYKRLGFTADSGEQESDGIRFTPMRRKLRQ